MSDRSSIFLRIALCSVALTLLTLTAHAASLSVMTLNVRLPVAQDGPNRWEARREVMVDMLRAEAPDIIGTQELHRHQGDELAAALPMYAWFGTGRRGDAADEHMGIFYRNDRLRVLASGNFWLSDTPERPGSITWGHLFPRMVTWGRFQRISDGMTFTVYNTHLPYREQDAGARLRGAELIDARLRALPMDGIVLVLGDFNDAPDSPTHAALTRTLTDAWSAAPRRTGPAATFHGFTGQPQQRIDWILFRGLQLVEVRTVTSQREGRYPSDHFPVVADFDLPVPSQPR